MVAVAMTVNGKSVSGEVEPRTLLVEFLREHLGLTGTHIGCDTSQCGACVIHVAGASAKRCVNSEWYSSSFTGRALTRPAVLSR